MQRQSLLTCIINHRIAIVWESLGSLMPRVLTPRNKTWDFWINVSLLSGCATTSHHSEEIPRGSLSGVRVPAVLLLDTISMRILRTQSRMHTSRILGVSSYPSTMLIPRTPTLLRLRRRSSVTGAIRLIASAKHPSRISRRRSRIQRE